MDQIRSKSLKPGIFKTSNNNDQLIMLSSVNYSVKQNVTQTRALTRAKQQLANVGEA